MKFTGVCTLSWAFTLWLGVLALIGAKPCPDRLPWKTDHGLWALGAVTASGVVSTVLSLSPQASFWGLGGYYGGCMTVSYTHLQEHPHIQPDMRVFFYFLNLNFSRNHEPVPAAGRRGRCGG